MKQKYYFYDLHCHTSISPDSPGKIKNVVSFAKKRGLSGVAITDHNKLYCGPLNIDGIDIIPGSEVTTKEGSHLLCYFIVNEIQKGKTMIDTINDVHKQGGFVVWAHPLRHRKIFFEHQEKIIPHLDGIEAGNAMGNPLDHEILSEICKKMVIGKTAGSDGHIEGQIGMAAIKVTQRISKNNFINSIQEAEVIVRKEVSWIKDSAKRWRKPLKIMDKILNTINSATAKNMFNKIIIHNYLRINNIRLRKIRFNYKDESLF